MLFSENILVALAGLKANKMRSLLTMLGIIIGIASVITIKTIGNTMTQFINEKMQSMGANNIQVGIMQKEGKKDLFYGRESDTYVRPMTDDDLISPDMLKSFREKFKDEVTYVVLSEYVTDGNYQKSEIVQGDRTAKVSVVGYNEDSFKFNKTKILGGRAFLKRDYDEAKRVCLLSDRAVERLYDGNMDEAIGKPIEVTVDGTYYTYYVVGVYEYVEQSLSLTGSNSPNPVTDLQIPYSTARNENHNQNKGYSYFNVVTAVGVDNNSFSKEMRDYFNVNFYSRNDAYDVIVLTASSMMEEFNSIIGMVETGLTVIAAISLLVGGIGVMNIMLVSITERTKEIGTRKALGATNFSIRLQFITEAVVICIIGGIIGIFLGVGLGTVIMKFVNQTAVISPDSILLAVGFSMVIGTFFGYYPANKAAKLNPIDALRYE